MHPDAVPKSFDVSADDCTFRLMCMAYKGSDGLDHLVPVYKCTHPRSGAHAIGRNFTSDQGRKVDAFRKMTLTERFKAWARIQAFKRFGRKIDTVSSVSISSDGSRIWAEVYERGTRRES